MSFPDLPATQTAIITQADLTLGISNDVPTPLLLEPDMVVIKNVAVALNHADHKMPASFPAPGAIDGCDFAGVVVKIGSAVTRPLKVGDRVFGAVHGSNPLCHQSGAFAEYVEGASEFLFHIPDLMSFETAVALGGVGIGTGGAALYNSLGLPTPENPAKIPFHVLVYGGSTACGTMAIQLLRLSGLIPIATCSPKNFALVKSYGAEEAFDYSSPTCASDIKAYTKNSLRFVLDTITSQETMRLCYSAIGRAGGKYTALEVLPQPSMRKTVIADWIMGITVFGKRIYLGPGYEWEPNLEHHDFGVRWAEIVQPLLDAGKLRPHPFIVKEGGFEGILKGVDILRNKAISAQRLVYHIS